MFSFPVASLASPLWKDMKKAQRFQLKWFVLNIIHILTTPSSLMAWILFLVEGTGVINIRLICISEFSILPLKAAASEQAVSLPTPLSLLLYLPRHNGFQLPEAFNILIVKFGAVLEPPFLKSQMSPVRTFCKLSSWSWRLKLAVKRSRSYRAYLKEKLFLLKRNDFWKSLKC